MRDPVQLFVPFDDRLHAAMPIPVLQTILLVFAIVIMNSTSGIILASVQNLKLFDLHD